MTMKMFAGAAALAALIATPAMAQMQQQQFAGPKQHTAGATGTVKMNKAEQARFGDRRAQYDDRRVGYRGGPAGYNDRYAGYRGGQNYYDDRRSGFWPGAVAAGVVGGAIGTAGAIATAPFRAFDDSRAFGNSYAYYGDSTMMMPSAGYAAPDPYGPKCVPGTIVTLNGEPMLCQ